MAKHRLVGIEVAIDAAWVESSAEPATERFLISKNHPWSTVGRTRAVIWQFIIHMVSGTYQDAFIELKDPVAVEKVIKENIPGGSSGGMLLLQFDHPKKESQEEMTVAMDAATTGFSAFGVLNTSGKSAIGPALGVQFLLNILGSGLLMFVMLAANPSSIG